MLDPGIHRVAIIGTGLLGGSVGLALRATGFGGTITGAGSRPATLQTAMSLGCINATAKTVEAAARDCDLLVIAAPVGKIASILSRIESVIPDHAVVTDVGSTKSSIVEAAISGTLKARFVGAHPMAGAETTGPQSARADLFHGKPVILTPTPHTAADALAKVESLWKAFGTQVFRMSPQEHDRLVAVISHIPHAAAVMLVQLAEQNGALPVASTGFADTTRLAMGDPELWADIFLDNREAVMVTLDQWSSLVRQFKDVLQSNSRDKLIHILSDAQRIRTGWRDRPKGTV